jgi:uncharacterized membrane protein YhaH (DUF805 family)
MAKLTAVATCTLILICYQLLEYHLTNPYSPPEAALNEPVSVHETYLPQLFALNGRIGRVRYLAYGTVFGLVMLPLLFLVDPAGGPFSGLQLAFTLVGLAISVILGRRRLNDMGRSGWFTIGLFIPLVNIGVSLWLLFGAGDAGPNRFGPPPAPNTRGVLIMAWLLPVLLIVTVIVAGKIGLQAGREAAGDRSSQSF